MKDRIVIVTGGGRGIGAATAKRLAQAGARVVVASRTLSQVQDVAKEIEQLHGRGRALAVEMDVSDEKSVKHLFAESRSAFGPLDVLVNNAAIVTLGAFSDLPVEEWDRTQAINVRGSYLCAREAFAQMRESGRGGAIINISSLGGIQSTQKFKGLSAYVVSKAAVIGLTESLAVEGREFGIRVNCVAPGAVDTEMLRQAAPFLKTETTPDDVAKIIHYLSDPAQSGALNGSVIEVHSNL